MQILVFPILALRVPVGDSFLIGAIFAVNPIGVSLGVQRMFEAIRTRGLQ